MLASPVTEAVRRFPPILDPKLHSQQVFAYAQHRRVCDLRPRGQLGLPFLVWSYNRVSIIVAQWLDSRAYWIPNCNDPNFFGTLSTTCDFTVSPPVECCCILASCYRRPSIKDLEISEGGGSHDVTEGRLGSET